MVVLGIILLAFIMVLLYACCVAASKDSRAIEQEEIDFYMNKK